MPTWGELLQQLQGMTTPRQDAYDFIRRQAIGNLNGYTKRDVILYAGGHLQKPGAPSLTSIDHSDMEGFMEAMHGLNGPYLDLVIHSPGGSVEATEAIGEYLSRGVFRDELKGLDSDLNISDLESDQQLQDLVLTVYHSAMHTFGNTRAAKIVENHLGKTYISLQPPEE